MFKKKIFILILTVLVVAPFFCFVGFADAGSLTEQVNEQLNKGAEKAGLKQTGSAKSVDPRIYASGIIQVLLSVYGIVFVILVVVAGYMLLTADGEEEQIKKAYKIILGAFIGLAIMLSAYGISSLVAKKAIEVTGYGVY